MTKGRIVRQISNLYTVLVSNTYIDARCRGKFRYTNITPVVGDIVDIDIEKKYIIDILPRKNYIKRPVVANIDLCLVVTSLKEPDLSLNLLDKELCYLTYNNIKPVIVLTKSDLLNIKELESINKLFDYYKNIGINVFYNNELDKLKNYLDNKYVVLTGQSGAGKSTLINMLGNKDIKTSAISKALGRGVHTTRHTQIYEIDNFWLIDTPGFSSLDITEIKKEELASTFIEFNNYTCKFNNCLHNKEVNCGIKEVIGKEILPSRYENYLKFLSELK